MYGRPRRKGRASLVLIVVAAVSITIWLAMVVNFGKPRAVFHAKQSEGLAGGADANSTTTDSGNGRAGPRGGGSAGDAHEAPQGDGARASSEGAASSQAQASSSSGAASSGADSSSVASSDSSGVVASGSSGVASSGSSGVASSDSSGVAASGSSGVASSAADSSEQQSSSSSGVASAGGDSSDSSGVASSAADSSDSSGTGMPAERWLRDEDGPDGDADPIPSEGEDALPGSSPGNSDGYDDDDDYAANARLDHQLELLAEAYDNYDDDAATKAGLEAREGEASDGSDAPGPSASADSDSASGPALGASSSAAPGAAGGGGSGSGGGSSESPVGTLDSAPGAPLGGATPRPDPGQAPTAGSARPTVDEGRALRTQAEVEEMLKQGMSVLTHNGTHTFLDDERAEMIKSVVAGFASDLKAKGNATEFVRAHWEDYASRVPDIAKYKHLLGKRGIVMLAGGASTFPQAMAAVVYLKTKLNSTLPVEIWRLFTEAAPPSSLSPVLLGLNVTVRAFPTELSTRTDNKYTYKPLALLFSSFDEALFLDSDAVAVRDPEPLFAMLEGHSGVFWRDFWTLLPDAKIWPSVGGFPAPGNYSPAQESGVLMVCKTCGGWKPLSLAAFFNYHHSMYYPLLYNGLKHGSHGTGDKDTFQLAWHALRVPFRMMEPPAVVGPLVKDKVCGAAFGQHDGDQKLVVLHHNANKWKYSDWKSGDLARNGLALSHVAEIKNHSLANLADGMDDFFSASIHNYMEHGIGWCVWYNVPTTITLLGDDLGADVEVALMRAINTTYSSLWMADYLAADVRHQAG